MSKITFDVPEEVLSALPLSPTEFGKEMRLAAALLWYSQGEISQSVGAEVAGIIRSELIDELSRRRIFVVQATLAELEEEIDRQ